MDFEPCGAPLRATFPAVSAMDTDFLDTSCCIRPDDHKGDCIGPLCGPHCRHPNPREKGSHMEITNPCPVNDLAGFSLADLMDPNARPELPKWADNRTPEDSAEYDRRVNLVNAYQVARETLMDEIAFARTLARRGEKLPRDFATADESDPRRKAWRDVLIGKAKSALKAACESESVDQMLSEAQRAEVSLSMLAFSDD